jgi:hypothetical protein
MWTFSGRKFDLLRATPRDVCIEDIAHALAHQCRFAGHVSGHYSVAQHSVLVSRLCDPADALWGLLHDASEAYVSDLPQPVKSLSGIGGPFRALEARVQRAVCERFGLGLREPPSVREADKQLALAEMADLMPSLPAGARGELNARAAGSRTRGLPTIDPVPARRARDMFTARFSALARAVTIAVAIRAAAQGENEASTGGTT